MLAASVGAALAWTGWQVLLTGTFATFALAAVYGGAAAGFASGHPHQPPATRAIHPCWHSCGHRSVTTISKPFLKSCAHDARRPPLRARFHALPSRRLPRRSHDQRAVRRRPHLRPHAAGNLASDGCRGLRKRYGSGSRCRFLGHLLQAGRWYERDGVRGPHEDDGMPGSGDRDPEYAPLLRDAPGLPATDSPLAYQDGLRVQSHRLNDPQLCSAHGNTPGYECCHRCP